LLARDGARLANRRDNRQQVLVCRSATSRGMPIVGSGKLRSKGKPFVYPNGARSERDCGEQLREQQKLKQVKPNTPPDTAAEPTGTRPKAAEPKPQPEPSQRTVAMRAKTETHRQAAEAHRAEAAMIRQQSGLAAKPSTPLSTGSSRPATPPSAMGAKLQAVVEEAVSEGLARAGVAVGAAQVTAATEVVGASLGRAGLLSEIGELKALREEIVRLAAENNSMEVRQLKLENERLREENARLQSLHRRSVDCERTLRKSLVERNSIEERALANMEAAAQPIADVTPSRSLLEQIAESNRQLQAQLAARAA